MRVLFLYPYLPSPSAPHGSARLVSRLLTGLRDRAEITLVCAHRPTEAEWIPSVRDLCSDVVVLERPFGIDMGAVRRTTERATTAGRLVTTGFPTPVVKLRRRGFHRALRTLLKEREFDVAHVELSVMAQYVEHFPQLPSVLVDHECGGSGQGEARRWKTYIQQVYPHFSKVLTLTPEDRDELAHLIPASDLEWRPPGIPIPERAERTPVADRVLFFGSPSHEPNVDALSWLLDDILPRLTSVRPSARLAIGGFSPDHPLAKKASARPDVEILGFVEDLGAEIARASVVVSPVRTGRGIRIKNLETMALGAPLVTTPLGNRGIGAQDGLTCRLGTGAADLADAIARLSSDPERAERMGSLGRELVRGRFSVERQAEITLRVWQEVVDDGVLGRSRGDQDDPS